MTSKKITLSTVFTLFRIFLVPFIGHGIVYGSWVYSCMLFIIAAATDVIDGALARLLNERTTLGAYLDPLADKVLILSCYTAFASTQLPCIIMPWWFVIVLSIKEAMLVIGAFVGKMIKVSYHVRPTLLGKATMFLQTIFIVLLFACLIMGWNLSGFLYICIWIITAVAFASFVDYAVRGLQEMWLLL
ncbi:MAG: CDP-alcohol phosphatidyltransferase family protein [Candidatus Babeliaceae bacterium]|jgi:cardiolipin synthase